MSPVPAPFIPQSGSTCYPGGGCAVPMGGGDLTRARPPDGTVAAAPREAPLLTSQPPEVGLRTSTPHALNKTKATEPVTAGVVRVGGRWGTAHTRPPNLAQLFLGHCCSFPIYLLMVQFSFSNYLWSAHNMSGPKALGIEQWLAGCPGPGWSL